MDPEKEAFLKRFGAHLKAHRQAKGLSTIEMARLMHMDSGNFTRIESGKTNPTIITISTYCKVLEIGLEELFKGFNPTKP